VKNFKVVTLAIFFAFLGTMKVSTAIEVTKKEVKVGVIFRLNDKYNTFPQKMLKAMEFALDFHQESSIRLYPVNHDGSALSLKKAVDKVLSYGVKLIVGGETSSDAILISRMIPKENVIFITPTASSHLVHRSNSNSFRMMLDGSKMKHLVREVLHNEKCSELGVLHNVSKPNADYISKEIIKDASSAGTKVLAVTVLADEKDFSRKVKVLADRRIPCISIFSFESDFRQFIAFMKDSSYFPILIGGDGWGNNRSVLNKYFFDKKKIKAYRALYWNNNNRDAYSSKVRRSYHEKYKVKMNAFTAIGYDTAKLIIDLVNSSATLSPEILMKTLRSKKFKNFLTTDYIIFGEEGSPSKLLHSYILEGEKAVYWKGISVP